MDENTRLFRAIEDLNDRIYALEVGRIHDIEVEQAVQKAGIAVLSSSAQVITTGVDALSKAMSKQSGAIDFAKQLWAVAGTITGAVVGSLTTYLLLGGHH